MVPTLDVLTSRAVYLVRLMERAVHDSGPWVITVQGHRCYAEQVLLAGAVEFRAEFEGLDPGTAEAVLECNGDALSWRSVRVPAGGAVAVCWEVSVRLEAVSA